MNLFAEKTVGKTECFPAYIAMWDPIVGEVCSLFILDYHSYFIRIENPNFILVRRTGVIQFFLLCCAKFVERFL